MPMSKEAPTLKDLAAKLGLSVSTVSLGLRHCGTISRETRERIERAAKEMGFRPNLYAAALSTRSNPVHSHDLPLVILRRRLGKDSKILYPTAGFVASIQERCTELGYRTECFEVQDTKAPASQLALLFNRGFRGIFLPPEGAWARWEDYDWSPFAVIACGNEKNCPFHSVTDETFESSRFLLDEMIRRGYRNIGVALVAHAPSILGDDARMAAAQFVHSKESKRNKVYLASADALDEADFARFVIENKIDAVAAFHVGFYYALKNAGVAIPKEVGFASMHTGYDQWSRHISGLKVLELEKGRAAANRMDTMIRHHESGLPAKAEQITFRGEWFPGETLPFRNQPVQ